MSESKRQELLAKSDSLFAHGVDLYNSKKYKQAIPVFSESDQIDKAVLDSTSNRRDYSAIWLASCYYQLGDTLKAAKTHKYYDVTPVDRRLTVKSDSLAAVGHIAFNNGELENALSYFTQCARIEKSVVGEDHVWYLNTLSSIAFSYYKLAWDNSSSGKFSVAIKLGTKAMNIYEIVYGKEHPDYANSLNNLAIYNCNLGNYPEAIRFGTEALNICEKVYGTEHPNYATSLNNLAGYNSDLGNYSEAIRLCTEALNICEKVYGKEHQDYIRQLRKLAKYMSEEEDSFSVTISLAAEAKELTEAVYGKYTTQYAEILDEFVNYCYYGESNLWQDPIACFKISKMCSEVYDVMEQVYGSDFENDKLMNQLAYCCEKLKDYDETLTAYEKALEATLRKYPLKSYGVLEGIAKVYYLMGNAEMAIDYALQARDVYEALRESGQWNSTYEEIEDCFFDEKLVKYYMLAGMQEKTDSLLNDRIKTYSRRYGTGTYDYANHTRRLFNTCVDCAYYDEALRLGQTIDDVYAVSGTTKQIEYEQLLKSMLLVKLRMGKNSDAYDYLTKLQAVKGATTTDDAVQTLNDIAASEDDDAFALKIYDFARSVITYYSVGRPSGLTDNYKQSVPYTQIRLKQAERYANMDDYEKALEEADWARHQFREQLGNSSVEYAEATRLSAKYLCRSKADNGAARLFVMSRVSQAQEIFEKHYGTNHPLSAIAVQDRAEYMATKGNFSAALTLGQTALYRWNYARNSEQIGTRRLAIEHNDDYARCLRNLSFYCYKNNNYQEAINIGQIVEKLYFNSWSKIGTAMDIIGTICLLAEYACAAGDTTLCSDNVATATYLYSQYIKQKFSKLSSNHRNMLWGTNSQWFEHKVPFYAYKFATTDLIDAAYNSVLLYKGLLLNSEIAFRDLIMQSGDSTAISRNIDIEQNKKKFSYDLAYPEPVDSSSESSLKNSVLIKFWNKRGLESAYRSEGSLMDQTRRFGDYTKNLTITWNRVRSGFSNGDAAVEFASFPLNADSTMYVAYVLRKDWEHPKMIPLFEEKQLLAVQKEDKYTTDSISRLVWKPLDEVMQGVERVYFAPSGELYNIAIESIPTHEDGGETLVGEHRDFYRLSSTRELALIKDESRWDEAAVYGGLQYGMSVKGMIEEDGKYEKAAGQKRGDSTPGYYVVREDSIGRDDRDVAQGLAYLEGTKREAEAITHDLERKAVDARLFTDSIGTETSFKALGGKKTSIIHIGTHGFFNDRKKEYKDDKLQLLGIDQQAKVIEDDALTRSGLYFAGADNVILNGLSAVPDSIDDGRLTAAEIAQLDLRGLDMVVLSACQTGLGEITGDGVFGLQRGFKKAGAQTIVMSLWKVDDEATTEFMTTFFENIKIDRDGHPLNKHEAFKEAQSKLKQDKDKYSDPYCWAAFVMLDGIR